MLDGTLTVLDIGDAPRVWAVDTFTSITLVPLASTVVAQVTVAAPAAGRVVLNTSGFFFMNNTATIDQAECSITPEATISSPFIRAWERAAADFNQVPFGITRTFGVTANSTTTFRLVCYTNATEVRVVSPVLNAIFIPGS